MYGTIIIIFVALIIVSLVGFFIIMELKHKIRVTIKELTNNRKVIRQYRAREYIDKDKVLWWRLAGEKIKERKNIPVPPESAIEIDNKGRKYSEGYRTTTGEIIWIKDNENSNDLLNKKEIISKTQPITTNQRMLYLNNIRKAEDRNKNKDWKEMVLQLAPLGALVMVIICLMIFWGDLAQPAINVQNTKAQQLEIQQQTVQLLHDMKASVQTIDSRLIAIEDGMNVPD